MLEPCARDPEHPCEDCWLIEFLPPGKPPRGRSLPPYPAQRARRYGGGFFGAPADNPEVAAAVRTWLRKRITELEAAGA